MVHSEKKLEDAAILLGLIAASCDPQLLPLKLRIAIANVVFRALDNEKKV